MTPLSDGATSPGWRDFERAIAAVLGGGTPEGKQVFDVLVPSKKEANAVYGISVKSKELSRKSAIDDLAGNGRVYMELSNSNAKFWYALAAKGVTDDDFKNQRQPQVMGQTILDVVASWHAEDAARFEAAHPNMKFKLAKSIYLTVSYSKKRKNAGRNYQLHSFGLKFPREIQWSFLSPKCLRGFDPSHPSEVLFDWYGGGTGGQLKYYPRASEARFASKPFQLEQPRVQPVIENSARYWPELWKAAGGELDIAPEYVIRELKYLLFWNKNADAQRILEHALSAMLQKFG